MSRISVEARKCPQCGTDFDAAAMEAGRSEVRKRNLRTFVAIALIVVAGVIWLSWPGNVEQLGQSVAEVDAR